MHSVLTFSFDNLIPLVAATLTNVAIKHDAIPATQ
jgi:hypothetical protein